MALPKKGETLFELIFTCGKPIIAVLHMDEAQADRTLRDLDVLNPLVDGIIFESRGWETFWF